MFPICELSTSWDHTVRLCFVNSLCKAPDDCCWWPTRGRSPVFLPELWFLRISWFESTTCALEDIICQVNGFALESFLYSSLWFLMFISRRLSASHWADSNDATTRAKSLVKRNLERFLGHCIQSGIFHSSTRPPMVPVPGPPPGEGSLQMSALKYLEGLSSKASCHHGTGSPPNGPVQLVPPHGFGAEWETARFMTDSCRKVFFPIKLGFGMWVDNSKQKKDSNLL